MVPITGEIQIASVALVRRALSEASSRGASRVVLLIDTPGGELVAMKDIATVTNEFAGGSKDTLSAIEEIKRLTERLHRTAHRFVVPEARSSDPPPLEIGDAVVDAAD